MKRKLKNAQGETLIEVLASILIGALSVALLFTAVMASINMDRTAQKTDGSYNEVLNAAEEQGTVIDSSIIPPGTQVSVKNTAGGVEQKITVNFYGGDGALSYKLPSP